MFHDCGFGLHSCVFVLIKIPNGLLYPPHNEVLLCPSVRPSVRSSVPHPVSAYSSVGSISYLYILSNNFRRCVACKVSCKFSKFEFLAIFFIICNFDFVLFWLGIWCESPVWVIMGRRGVSQNARVLVVIVYHVFVHVYLTVITGIWTMV